MTDFLDWCKQNIPQSLWHCPRSNDIFVHHFAFHHEKDAMLFKLTFSEHVVVDGTFEDDLAL